MSEDQPEAVESEVETDGQITVTEPPQTADQMDTVIAVAQRIDAYAKAMDTIISAVVKRSYPGDWVVHKKTGESDENQKANMGAAAAERMATFTGITEKNWTLGAKEFSEDRKHFTYAYEADFTFGKRTIHVISRVGTRDKFFGKANKEWIPLEDVQEDDIKKAAFRACRKEGVRTLLGLRNVPVAKLRDLGFDIAKINFVGFGEKMSDADKKAVDDKGLIWKEIKVASVEKKSESKDPKKPWMLWAVNDGKLSYTMFANTGSDRLLKLYEHQEDQTPVKIGIKIGEYNGKEQYSIEMVDGEVKS